MVTDKMFYTEIPKVSGSYSPVFRITGNILDVRSLVSVFRDLRLTTDAPQYFDSSAGAIAACGLLRLAQLTGNTDYHQQAETLVNTLSVECLETDPDRHGLLKYGAQHVPEGIADEYLIYGDYYFLEALLTLTGQVPDFWGPGI